MPFGHVSVERRSSRTTSTRRRKIRSARRSARGTARGRAQFAADAHNLRQSLDVFKRIKSELEAKIVQLEGAALQARHATPQKEPKGKEPAAWAVKGFEQMLAYTDVRPPRAQARMQSVPATGAGPSSYAPAYSELPDDAFPVY